MLEATSALLGWALAWPLTLLVRRDADLVVFWGRDGGKFLDNCKYLYIATRTHKPWLRAAFLGTIPSASDIQDGVEAGVRGLRAKWLWLRAGTIIVDSVDWQRGMRVGGSQGARIVQLWHGVPLKQVQLGRIKARRAGRWTLEAAAFQLYLYVVGRLAEVDWLLSTSKAITERAFSSSFRYENVSHAGYPRNDVLLREPSPMEMAGIDLAAKRAIAEHRRRGGHVMLYAPTFREGFPDPFAPGGVDLARLAQAACTADLLLLVKLHPWMRGKSFEAAPPGIRFVTADSDIYPLLRDVDLLVTDYSSVFFDFLLLDRPVLFFPYDLDAYVGGDRPLYFDYGDMTPGPKYSDVSTLAEALPRAIQEGDAWRGERARVRSLVFDHHDAHSAERLLDELFPAGSPRFRT
jgi:CDP-glycerol glycerophosphotransferase